jgi:hypothetical protein
MAERGDPRDQEPEYDSSDYSATGPSGEGASRSIFDDIDAWVLHRARTVGPSTAAPGRVFFTKRRLSYVRLTFFSSSVASR